jgi:hypothetical protein
MAKWVTTAATADHHTGSVHVRIERSMFSNDLLVEMVSWLARHDRPGSFSYRDARRELNFNKKKNQVVSFHITDPDVAMEFKMRWF